MLLFQAFPHIWLHFTLTDSKQIRHKISTTLASCQERPVLVNRQFDFLPQAIIYLLILPIPQNGASDCILPALDLALAHAPDHTESVSLSVEMPSLIFRAIQRALALNLVYSTLVSAQSDTRSSTFVPFTTPLPTDFEGYYFPHGSPSMCVLIVVSYVNSCPNSLTPSSSLRGWLRPWESMGDHRELWRLLCEYPDS